MDLHRFRELITSREAGTVRLAADRLGMAPGNTWPIGALVELALMWKDMDDTQRGRVLSMMAPHLAPDSLPADPTAWLAAQKQWASFITRIDYVC